MYSKIALFLAAAAVASAQTATEIAELNLILDDVKDHLNDYMSLATDPSSGITLANLPAGVLDIGMALASATDNSYTTLYKEVDFNAIVVLLPKLPWYSSRLEDKLNAILSTSAPASSSAATSSAPASSSAATSSAPVSSSAATSSAPVSSSAAASSSAATTTSKAASSSAATTTSKAASSSAAATSSKGNAAAISQITDGQIQATHSVAHQTENGAAKAVAGLGAGALAAAALLL